MAVPKKTTTRSKQGKRRQHHKIKPVALFSCSKCGQLSRPHYTCPSCGYYRGKEVINVLEKLNKKERKQREKEIKEKEKSAPPSQ